MKILRATSLGSNFTGSYKKLVYATIHGTKAVIERLSKLYAKFFLKRTIE